MAQSINFLVALLSVLVLVYVLLFAWSLKRFSNIWRYRHDLLRSNLQLQSWNRRVQTAVFLSLVLATFVRTICFGAVAGFCWMEKVNISMLEYMDETVCNPFNANGDFFGHFGYLLFTSPSFFIDLTYIMLFNLLIIVWVRTKAVHEDVSLDIVRPRLIYSTIGCSVFYFLAMSILILIKFEQNRGSDQESVLIAQGAAVLIFCFIAVLGLIIMRCFVRDIDYRSPMSRIRFCRTVKTFAWWTFARMLYGFGMVFYTSAISWATLATHSSNHTLLVIVVGIVMCFATEILPIVLIVQRGFFHLLVQIDDWEIQDEQCLSSPNIGSDHNSNPSLHRGNRGLSCITRPGDSLPLGRATHWASRNFVRAVALSLEGHEYLVPRDTKRLGSLQVGVDPSSHSKSSATIRIMSGKQLPSRFIMQECIADAKRLVDLSHPNVVPLVAFVPEAPLMQTWRTQSACWIVTGGDARCSLYAYLHSTSRYNRDSSCSASNLRLVRGENSSRRAMLLSAVSHYCGGFRRGVEDTMHFERPSQASSSLWDAFKWDCDTGRDLSERRKEKLMGCIGLFRQIADGMTYLHEWGVAHGHLSPHNILVQDNSPGEALSLQIADAGFHGLKRYASLVGTYEMRNPWSAPEFLSESRKSFEKESDVYTLGLLLWELMTSQEPFLGLTLGAITKAVNDKQRPEVPQANSALQGALNSLIHGCWQHEPSKRMQCADILGEVNDIEMRFR